MRRTALLMASTVLAVLLSCGVALAVNAVACEGGGKRCVGTDRPDLMRGTGDVDAVYGRDRGDTLKGFGDTDALLGQRGEDTLAGGPGPDRLLGGAGEDRLKGGSGADVLVGGADGDRLVGGAGADRLVGGKGDDHLLARDGETDSAVCGAGEDTVVADPEDEVAADCERVSPQPEGTTRGVPYPFGGVWPTSDGWRLEVLEATPDATPEVRSESDANSAPRPGDVYTLVRVRATRTAAHRAVFDADIRLRAVGQSSAVVYSTFEDSCGLTPDAVPDTEVSRGESVVGNVCWSVPESAASGLVMVDSPLTEDEQRFFALR